MLSSFHLQYAYLIFLIGFICWMPYLTLPSAFTRAWDRHKQDACPVEAALFYFFYFIFIFFSFFMFFVCLSIYVCLYLSFLSYVFFVFQFIYTNRTLACALLRLHLFFILILLCFFVHVCLSACLLIYPFFLMSFLSFSLFI